MKNKNGFLLEEALLCVALCSVICLTASAVCMLESKKEETMKKFEEDINRSWEEIFAQLSECQACPIEETQEEETS